MKCRPIFVTRACVNKSFYTDVLMRALLYRPTAPYGHYLIVPLFLPDRKQVGGDTVIIVTQEVTGFPRVLEKTPEQRENSMT